MRPICVHKHGSNAKVTFAYNFAFHQFEAIDLAILCCSSTSIIKKRVQSISNGPCIALFNPNPKCIYCTTLYNKCIVQHCTNRTQVRLLLSQFTSPLSSRLSFLPSSEFCLWNVFPPRKWPKRGLGLREVWQKTKLFWNSSFKANIEYKHVEQRQLAGWVSPGWRVAWLRAPPSLLMSPPLLPRSLAANYFLHRATLHRLHFMLLLPSSSRPVFFWTIPNDYNSAGSGSFKTENIFAPFLRPRAAKKRVRWVIIRPGAQKSPKFTVRPNSSRLMRADLLS